MRSLIVCIPVNAFRIFVIRHRSISVRFPFSILSVSVLYPFRSHSRTHSVSVLYPFGFAFPVRFLLSGAVAHHSCLVNFLQGKVLCISRHQQMLLTSLIATRSLIKTEINDTHYLFFFLAHIILFSW